MSIVKKNIVANFAGTFWQAIMSLAFVPLYIKYLGVESYGLIGIFALLQAWLALLDMGMTPTLSREMARFTGGSRNAQSIRDLLRSIEVIVFVIAIFIAFSLWVVSNWLASEWLRVEKLPVSVVAQAIALMGVVIGLRFVENIYRSSIVGLQKQVLFNIASIIMATLRGLGGVGILMWVSPTIGAFFIWQGIVSIVTVILFSAVLYLTLPAAKLPARFSMKELNEVQRFATGMMAIAFLAPILTQIDKILLSRLISLEIFGYYALAGTMTSALYMISGPVTAALYPRFTELIAKNDMPGLISDYHKGAQLVTVFMGTGAIILMVFGSVIISLWTRNPVLVENVSPLVVPLALGTLINGMLWIPYQLQLGYGWTRLTLKATVFVLALVIPTIFWVAPRYGALGAAWVWVGINAIHGTIIVYFMHRRLLVTEKWIWYRQDVVVPLFAAFITAQLCCLAMAFLQGAFLQFIGLLISAAFVLIMAGLFAPAVRQQFISCLPEKAKSILRVIA